MPVGRLASFILLLASILGSAAPVRAELAWPELCARIDAASRREPDEVRRYRMRLNDRPAGRETFRFWRDAGRIRVAVETELEGDILIFPADFRHCREESWRARAGGLDLLALDGATTYAVPFKPDWQVHIERAADGGMLYRGTSGLGAFEERWPDDTGVVSPWSIRTTGYARLLNVFEHGVYRIESRPIGRATVDGREIVHYAFAGEWPRHLWYDHEGRMIRFCAEEAFDSYIETTLEAYADLDIDAAGLNRSCAVVFQSRRE